MDDYVKDEVVMRSRFSCRVALLSLILPLLTGLPSSAGVTQDAYERGLQAAEENQFQRAVGELTQAIELNPKDADAYAIVD
jgi:Flp pilus assembly protein TadD